VRSEIERQLLEEAIDERRPVLIQEGHEADGTLLHDPEATHLGATGRFGLGVMGVFLAILVVAFIYEWKKGALEWD